MKGTDFFAALILLFLLGTPVLVLINPSFIKKGIGRRKAGIIGIALFIASFIGFGMSSDKEKAAAPQPVKVESKQETKSTSPTTAETKSPTPTPSTDDMVKAAVTKALGKTKYDVKFDADVKLVTITLPDEMAWDETAMVKGVFSIIVDSGLEVFKIPAVEAISVVRMAEMTDTYGKKAVEKVVQFTFEKEEFSKYDWNNLKFTNVYNQMMTSTSMHYIHPGIMKKVDTSKLYLTF